MWNLILSILICSAATVAVQAAPQPGASALAQAAVVVGVDVDTNGNESTSLGDPQFCRSVEPGDTFDVDVFLDEIPDGRDLAGFSYALGYDSARASVQAKEHRLLLVANRDGSGVADLSEDTPDSDGEYRATVADLSPTGVQPGPLAGVLGRYTVEVAASAETGVFALTVGELNLADGAATDIPVDEIQNAKIAVGKPCSSEDQTPATVRPTPKPTVQPTSSRTPNVTQSPGTTTPQTSGSTPSSPTRSGQLPGTNDDDGGFPWTAALISAVAGIAVLAGGGALVWRRRPWRGSDGGL